MINKVYKSSTLFLIIALFTLLACNGKTEKMVHFKSGFNGIGEGSWIGPDYWPNTPADWQLSGDRLECLVSIENRNVHLLSRQLGSKTGNLEMAVMMGFFNTSQAINNKNWAGFSLGAKSGLSGKKDYTIFRNGLNIGITTNGVLFIGNPSPNRKNETVIKSLERGVILKVQLSPEENTYGINLSVHDKNSGKLLANIFKNQVGNESLSGDLALVSNFIEEGISSNSALRSVWFKDWNMSGSKLTMDVEGK